MIKNYQATNTATPGNDWDKRHNEAMKWPRGVEAPIVGLIRAMEAYADQYRERYESEWSDDRVLNRALVHLAYGIRDLLNGETGRLDCGTIDAELVKILKSCGESV